MSEACTFLNQSNVRDYIFEKGDSGWMQEMTEHLRVCEACRAFERTTRKSTRPQTIKAVRWQFEVFGRPI